MTTFADSNGIVKRLGDAYGHADIWGSQTGERRTPLSTEQIATALLGSDVAGETYLSMNNRLLEGILLPVIEKEEATIEDTTTTSSDGHPNPFIVRELATRLALNPHEDVTSFRKGTSIVHSRGMDGRAFAEYLRKEFEDRGERYIH